MDVTALLGNLHAGKKWRAVAGAALIVAGWLLVCPARAQGADTDTKSAALETPVPAMESHWFVRVGVLGAAYDSSATISTSGQLIPGATAHAQNNVTAIVDVGYDLTKDFAIAMMSGIPPRTAVEGRGSVAPFGTLGAVRYGPMFLTGIYRLPWEWGALRPYIGAGGAHAFIFNNFDGSVTQLKVHANSGYAFQAGLEYRTSDSWGFFVDYKRLWISLNADGLLGNLPVTARVALNPNLISAGMRYQF